MKLHTGRWSVGRSATAGFRARPLEPCVDDLSAGDHLFASSHQIFEQRAPAVTVSSNIDELHRRLPSHGCAVARPTQVDRRDRFALRHSRPDLATTQIPTLSGLTIRNAMISIFASAMSALMTSVTSIIIDSMA